MENATKALLIAAAVLIAILIISLGLVVYQKASETIESVNFSSQEVTAFNDQFTHYQGENIRGSEINAMLKTVLSSNMKSRSEGIDDNDEPGWKYVSVEGEVELEFDATTLGTVSADNSKLYKVTVNYHEETGFVSTIEVELQD